MTIPRPSPALAPPNITVRQAGTRLHRVHAPNRISNEFNPCPGNPTRFAPTLDVHGRCVPSLYAGSTFIAAAYESIFHDVPAHAKRKSVPLSRVTDSAHGTIELQREVRLASLREPDLARWKISRNMLIASSPKLYPQTAAWAKAIHDQFPEVDGLVWTSNRCDPDDASLFFGDRVDAADIRVVAFRDGRRDSSFLADVRRAGQRAGITITI